MVDITRLEQLDKEILILEKNLEKSERRFLDIVNLSYDWIWEVDKGFIYTYCSDRIEDILGYSIIEVIGKKPFDFMPPKEAERVKKLTNGILERREPLINVKNWNISKDGKYVCLLTNGVPIYENGNTKIIGYRGTDVDITKSEGKYKDG